MTLQLQHNKEYPMHKVFYNEDARRRILGGAQILYDAVKTTMGPKGRNVVIGKTYTGPSITHDGVTVAKAVKIGDVDDETLGYRMGAELINSAATMMDDKTGDGTTTVTVLTYNILKEANKLAAAGHNVMDLRKGMEAAAVEILEALDNMREDIGNDKKRLAQIATISAGDPIIGNLVADVLHEVGEDGIVTVEHGDKIADDPEIVRGYTFPKGYVSRHMVTDAATMASVLDNPAIIVTDKHINSTAEILPLIEGMIQRNQKKTLIIADGIDSEVLSTLLVNGSKGIFVAVVVKAPSFGENRKATLEDIATLTGAKVISEEQNRTFGSVKAEEIGSARKIIVTKNTTKIIAGRGVSEDINLRLENIKNQMQSPKLADIDKHMLKVRFAALSGKGAVIRVGGSSDTEIEERKYRVDDAVAAARAALQEGIVPGGGTTLLALSRFVKFHGKEDPTIEAGKRIVCEALTVPFRILLENANLRPDEWMRQVFDAKPGYGIDVTAFGGKLIDLKKAGIVDPARVTKEAIMNAISIAGTAVTMGALVVEVPEPLQQDADITSMGV
jgi:chaperonin GroEL